MVGVTLFCDFVGMKYKGVTYFVMGGMVALLALAELINDGSLVLQHDLVQSSSTYATYSINLTSNFLDMSGMAAALAVFGIAHFLFVIERQSVK